MTIKDLKPSEVWNNFHLLTQQPRPSKHEEKVRAFLLEWASKHDVEAFADETGNVIMRIPATKGYENCKGVVLQGHMDMVPQKNSEVKHDFEKDPIQTWIDGPWVKAKGTTLGADNGLGIAMAMSVAEDKTLAHGPIEILITYDEETGMTGAAALKSGVLKGDILINLDSETEGELYVGCAGGLDFCASDNYTQERPEEGFTCWNLAVKGCQGGHSGMDIILCRANANRLAARILSELISKNGARLSSFEGGTLRNAIPREAFAKVYLAPGTEKEAFKTVQDMTDCLIKEYEATDPNLKVTFEPCEGRPSCIPAGKAITYVRCVLACPDGVERMSDSMPGMVETSNNLAMVKADEGKFSMSCLMRSSVDSAKEALAARIESVFALAGIQTGFSGGYSGWAPNAASPILHLMKDIYKKMYGKEPLVMAIHAGLECGILSGAYPHWDMVSMGPTLMSPHSPDERADIASVQKVWDFLKEVLRNIPKK